MLAVCLILASGQASEAQNFFPDRLAAVSPAVTIDEADGGARGALERIDALFAAKKYEEAVDGLLRLQDTAGEKLFRLESSADHGYTRCVCVRELVQLRLVALARTAPEALALYRRQADPLAEREYQRAVSQRDEPRMRRVAQQFFASSLGDKSLASLGEMALERGDYPAARAAWEQISPQFRWPEKPPPGLGRGGISLWQALSGVDLEVHWAQLAPILQSTDPPSVTLAFPDTGLNLSDIRARLVLVSILEGARDRARLELEILRRLQPTASGVLGGRSGKWVDLLGDMLRDSEHWPGPSRKDWTTFAQSHARNAAAPESFDLPGKPAWTIPLPPPLKADGDQLGLARPRVAEDLKELLSYFPIVVQGRLYLVDYAQQQTRVRAFNLADGRPAWPRTADRESGEIYPAGKGAEVILPTTRHLGVPRFTLEANAQHLFARLGNPLTAPLGDIPPVGEQGYLIGLDLAAQGRVLPAFPLRPDDPKWSFEGTPVCEGGSLYVAMRLRGGQSQLHVAAFDASTGRLRWRRLVAGADTPAHGNLPEMTHTLLSLRGGVLYVNSNLGAVAALQTDDGSFRWLTTYRRATDSPDRGGAHWFRSLTPCLLHQDLVIVAPSDSDAIFALDAYSGRLRWETRGPDEAGAIDAVHLLGAGQGHLLASGRFLWWIDVETGRLAARFPEDGSGQPGLAFPNPQGFGRGLLAGDEVIWPTREKLYVFKQRPAGPGRIVMSRQPISLVERDGRGGNLLLGDGYLLIAGAEKITAYRLIETTGGTGKAALPDAP